MEDFARHIAIQTEGASNVLVIELQQGETLIPYCCKVMEGNQIPGLLPMRHQMMDGVVRLRYNIGGRVPLREFMLRHHLPYKKGLLLLRNLCQALLHLNEYFLSADMCYLDPEYIYVGDGLTVYLPCVPVEHQAEQGGAARLKQFFEKLLSEYFATADCNSYDDMFKWVYKATLFDLETFCQKFLQEVPTNQEAAPAPAADAPRTVPEPPPAPEAPAVSESAPAAKEGHELTEILQEKMKGLQYIYTGVSEEKPTFPKPHSGKRASEKADAEPRRDPGFAIPGAPEPKAPQKEKAEKEKKGFWPFAGKAAREEEKPAPAPRRQTASVQSPARAADRPAKPVRPSPAPAKPEPSDDWEDGTILVGREPTPSAHKEVAPAAAYLVHNNQKIPIRETPFLLGKYNTTIQLHYAIYDNNKVSRNHATILQENGQYFVRDNQSRNGTSVNGKAILPLQPVALQDGDEIKLYDEVLIFHLGVV